MISRREFLRAGSALLLSPCIASATETAMPSLFYGHGGPPLARDKHRAAELFSMAQQLPSYPRGIVAFTPHVRARQVTIASSGIARWSFPRRFVKTVGDIRYHPPLATDLGQQVLDRLAVTKIPHTNVPHKGFNHTIWMGLLHLFPQADIPVIEVAMPFLPAARLFEFGQALASLRQAGILIVSSGTVTHNLGSFGHAGEPPVWAREYDQWAFETIAKNDIDAVIDWRNRAPAANIAHPDDGAHFNVMMFALGAAVGRSGGLDQSRTMHEGYEFGTFSNRGFLFG